MYIVGSDHPNKVAARKLLERLSLERVKLVTDAEVFQEILHRYISINRRDAIKPATELLRAVVDEVYPIDMNTVMAAAEAITADGSISARDAVHVTVMRRNSIDTIMTFDQDFNRVPGLKVIP
jgi:predicted nucleic acid-binding protein